MSLGTLSKYDWSEAEPFYRGDEWNWGDNWQDAFRDWHKRNWLYYGAQPDSVWEADRNQFQQWWAQDFAAANPAATGGAVALDLDNDGYTDTVRVTSLSPGINAPEEATYDVSIEDWMAWNGRQDISGWNPYVEPVVNNTGGEGEEGGEGGVDVPDTGIGDFSVGQGADGQTVIYDAEGNIVWDVGNLEGLVEAIQDATGEYTSFGNWLQDYGLSQFGYTVEDGMIYDTDGNAVMSEEQWNAGGAQAALFAPQEYSPVGIQPVDTDGDGVYDQLLDANGNEIFSFDQSLLPDTTWEIQDGAIVDEFGNVLFDLTDLPADFDVTTTDPYQAMTSIAELLQNGATDEDLAAAKAYMALQFGMTSEQWDASMVAMSQRVAGGPEGYGGMSEEDMAQRIRQIQTSTFNAQNRAAKMMNNMWAGTGSRSRAWMGVQDTLMNIYQEEVQGYIALADEDYARQVANYEAEEAFWQSMVEAGRLGMSEYLTMLSNNRSDALEAYSTQVNAMLTQHDQELEAALRSREMEVNTFLAKYGMNLDAYLAQAETVMDKILLSQELLQNQEIAWNDDRIAAAQTALATYQSDMQTVGQHLEGLYLAMNAELGLDEAVMDWMAQQFEWDVAEWSHQWDQIMANFEYQDLQTISWDEQLQMMTPILLAIIQAFA